MIELAAWLYAAIIGGVIIFQFCLIAGAPWGRLTQGGRHEGALPVSGRVGAAVSVALLVGMAGSVTSAAGLAPHWPEWTGWGVLAVQVLSTVLNWITPSRAERLLWGPVTSVMLVLAAFVVLSR